MGRGRWTDTDWENYAKTNIYGKSTVKDIYRTKHLDKDLNPKNVVFRESCDSPESPFAAPLIVGLDVTGSMGFIPEKMARSGLKELASEIYERKPIGDMHIMFMGIGDVVCDRAPLQVTQFEADIKIAEQLTKIYLEGGGGGNACESYTLAWYFAAMHTKCDNFIKRGKKGYLFTIGDECPPEVLTSIQIESVLGYYPQFNQITTKQIYDLVSRQYEVFHIIVEEASFCLSHYSQVVNSWRKILGEHTLLLSDYKKLPQLIVSTLQLINGKTKSEILDSWDNTTSLVIEHGVKDLKTFSQDNSEFIRF